VLFIFDPFFQNSEFLTVTFDQFNVSLLNKSINFIKKSYPSVYCAQYANFHTSLHIYIVYCVFYAYFCMLYLQGHTSILVITV